MEHCNRHQTPRPRAGLLIASLLSVTVAACGGGSGQANRLLRQTFAGKHPVESGRLGVRLTVIPSGSSTSRGRITFSLAGPFQSLGPGRLPASAFSVSLAVMGTDAAATITSTGSTGYVTFQGQSYRLPQPTFQRLESTFAQLASASGRGSGSGMLGRLGIQPAHWLLHPQVVGQARIEGVKTTHIRSGINVAALLADVDAFLKRASSVGAGGAGVLPRGIPAAERHKLARQVKQPTVNVWTGVADKTLRRLEIDLTVPVDGQLSTLLGGSAAIGLTMQYAGLNQPQNITVPTRVLPYGQFQAKLRVLLRTWRVG